jgi:probable F420-dependent oxidoreductase
MRVGLALPIAPELNEPGAIGAFVRAAESLGFSSLWLSDHLLIPPGDFIPHRHQPDPLAMLGWLAATTDRVGIGTSVLVLPYRDPVVVAKAAGTADWLSGGRVTLGVGAGWLRAEFAALGIPFAERGARTDAALRRIRACWAEKEGVSARPTSAPGHAIPLIVGGNTPPAIRRAAALGDGWQPLNLTPAELVAALPAYREACERAGRTPGAVYARVSPPRLSGEAAAVRAELEAYEDAGAAEVIVSVEEDSGPAEVLRRVAGFAARDGLSAPGPSRP